MANPSIEVLGVYRLNVTDEILQNQISVFSDSDAKYESGAEAEKQARDLLATVVLIEVLVHERDDRFKVDDFVQARSGVAPSEWQAAWSEAYLSADGMSLASERWSFASPETPDLRIAFFIHFWDPARPLQSSYGEVICPPPRPMPGRLETLVPFEAVD